MYDAVLALLRDLLQSKSWDTSIDDCASTLIGELSGFFAGLEIAGMRLIQNNFSGQAIVATDLDRREILLTRLTPSELRSSIADLAAHLLHMVHLQSPQPASTLTAVHDPPPQAYVVTDDNHSPAGQSVASTVPYQSQPPDGMG